MDTKTCTKCKETKPLTEFRTNGKKKDGAFKHRSQCKPCSRSHHNEWTKKNAERKREYDKRQYEKNSDTVKARSAKRYADKKTDPSFLLARSEYNSSWWILNPEKRRSYAQNRRSLLQDAFVDDVQISTLRERDGDNCCICHSPIDFTLKNRDPTMVSLEHLTPLSRGGKHSYENTALSHLSCNLSKGTKTLEEVHELTHTKEAA